MTDAPTTAESISAVAASTAAIDTQARTLLIFRYFTLFFGLVGIIANALVMASLLAKKTRTRPATVLIINQAALDLFSCVQLVIAYSVMLSVNEFWEPWGTAVCLLYASQQTAVFIGVTASTTNVALITIERYVKIVHCVYHRKYFREWMTYAAIAISWISGIINNFGPYFESSTEDGRCVANQRWGSFTGQLAYTLLLVFWSYVVPTLIFVYCYSRILGVVRGSVGAHSSVHAPAFNQELAEGAVYVITEANKAKSSDGKRSQMKIIKTMMLVSLTFSVLWFPNKAFYIVATADILLVLPVLGWLYGSILLGFTTMCLNPFIYASFNDDIRKFIVSRLISKKIASLTTETSAPSRPVGDSAQ